MKRLLISYLFVLASTALFSQDAVLPTQLRLFLQQHEQSTQPIHFYVQGNVEEIEAYIRSRGGQIRHSISNYVAVSLPINEIEELAKQAFVTTIPFQINTPQVLNDSMRVNSNIVPVHDGVAPLMQAYTGKDVIIGVIDTGLDFTHGDFIDSLGNTRVLAIWDQKYPVAANTPLPFGYGQEWDSTDINAMACPHEDSSFVYYGHGTGVAGTAAGNGRATGEHMGAAPEADIIAVASDFYSPNWSTTLADAVDWIYSKADALGKPCVINLSLGNYAGSHDALDPATMYIESLITAKGGRALCAAAGNAGQIPIHVGYDVTTDTNFTWFEYTNNILGTGFGGVYIEAWADTADFNGVSYSLAADTNGTTIVRHDVSNYHSVADNLGVTVTDTLLNGTDTIAFVDFTLQLLDSRYRLEAYVYGDDAVIQQYYMAIQFTGSGRVDMWAPYWEGYSFATASGLPGVGSFPPIAYYVLPDTVQTMVDLAQCSDQVITVANYQNLGSYYDMDGNLEVVGGVTGQLTENTSTGPTRDNRQKPDIASPALFTMGANTLEFLVYLRANEPYKVSSDTMHSRGAGTSIASPSIAGICALYLEKCPNATNVEMMNAITGTAISDAYTGAVPNIGWGYGKADALAALLSSNFSVGLTYDPLCCGGDSVLISAPAGYAVYDWNTGDSLQIIYVDINGSYWATITDSSGCMGTTDTVTVLITGIPESGNDAMGIYPNPANDEVYIGISSSWTGNWQLEITDITGKLVWSEVVRAGAKPVHAIDVSAFERGTYVVRLRNESGAELAQLLELY